jgi:hypothetical protein
MAMLSLLRKTPTPTKPQSIDRLWNDVERSTSLLMKKYFEDREVFTMICGAVFALHQDVLKAFGVDMRKTHDGLPLVAAMEKRHPHPLGPFPTRVRFAMEKLQGIDDFNLNFIENGCPAHVNKEEYGVQSMMARMRSIAARVWLLTILSKSREATGLKLGVTNMWLMLQMVPAIDLVADAEIFTGTYFDGISSNPMDLKQWHYG